MSAPQQVRSVRSRQRLLDAARDLIREVGVEEMTLVDVAARAGVAVGTVYNRFDDKRHLLDEVVREWTGEVSARFDARRPISEGCDVRSQLRELVRLFRDERVFIGRLIARASSDERIAEIVTPWLLGEQARLVEDLLLARTARASRADLIATMVLATLERTAIAGATDDTWIRLEEELPDAAMILLEH